MKEIGKEMHSMMLVEKIDTYLLGQKMYTHHFLLPRLTASWVSAVYSRQGLLAVGSRAPVILG